MYLITVCLVFPTASEPQSGLMSRYIQLCATVVISLMVGTSRLQSGHLHLWNNEPHNEGHPHCKKLIVDNEPIWAHYQNNEPCSLCQKYNEGNNEGNNDAHCWAHCWRNTMRATMRLIVGERAPF